METEDEEIEKPKYNLTGDTREALQEYYDAVHLLCETQTNFAKSTQVLEQKIEDKSVFLSIIQQVQLYKTFTIYNLHADVPMCTHKVHFKIKLHYVMLTLHYHKACDNELSTLKRHKLYFIGARFWIESSRSLYYTKNW